MQSAVSHESEISSAEKDDSGNVDESAWAAVSTSTLAEGDYAEVSSSEPPANDPFGLQLSKLDADTADGSAQGIASLAGAIFELAYYDNTDGDTDGTALKTWYFETKASEDGKTAKINCRDASYLVEDYRKLNNGMVIKNAELYYNSDGDVIYPVGTYVIKEISSAEYYQLNGSIHLDGITGDVSVVDGLTYILKADPDTGDMKLYDKAGNAADANEIDADNELSALAAKVYEPVEDDGSITIIKNEDNSDTPIKGVTFKLVGVEDPTVELTGTTDENGKIVFDNLIPQHYVITEIATLDGLTLLEDNIEVTLPLAMTEDEIEEMGADIDAAKYDEASGKYCYYDLTYTVGNSWDTTFPMTGMGNTAKKWFPLFCGFGLATIAGLAYTIDSEKKKRKEA